jgi:hypothetical protein
MAQVERISSRDRGDDRLNASALLRVKIVDHGAAILSPVAFGTHTGATGRVEINPFRFSSNACLYSPRLVLCVTLET